METVVKGFLICLSFASAMSAAQAQTVLMSKKTVTLPVDLSSAGVRSSNAGYGTTYLVKILVPGLAAETLLNHRNEGEAAPCLATYDTDKVEDITQNNPTVENIKFTITEEKILWPNTTDKICNVTLAETINAVVRGHKFTHLRRADLPARHIDDCK
ncbi:hypothetical protein [Bdellovibrio svalbardensis]|uniref:Uncharacterized protein n=1 Tax=Bdellovibrio svalbardensis TaxID=2972972 RepID=A0ABT6DMA9_9BACT|nr:hypothetical protein [Bdellovibrio svalbardensis]MDG0818024.1 hypothetical protein [Bdellovibrio svalbardensis]